MRQDSEIYRRHRAGGIAEAYHKSIGAQASQGRLEGVLTHPVVDHRHPFAVGNLPHPFDDVFAAVVDTEIRSVFARQFAFFSRTGSADHPCAKCFQPLTGNRAHAACRRVEQYRIAGLYPVGLADEILDRKPLEHHCRCLFITHLIGNQAQPVGWNDAGLAVGAKPAGIRDPVARPYRGNPLADRFHHPCAFIPGNRRERHLIKTCSLIDIDEIHPYGMVANTHITGTRFRNINVHPAEDFRPSEFAETDCFAHIAPPLPA